MICGGRGPQEDKTCFAVLNFGQQIFRKMSDDFDSKWLAQDAPQMTITSPLSSGDVLTMEEIGPPEAICSAQSTFRSFRYQRSGHADHASYTRRFTLDAHDYVLSTSSLGWSFLLDAGGKMLAKIDRDGKVNYDVKEREPVEKIVWHAIYTVLGYKQDFWDSLRCGPVSLTFQHAGRHVSVKS